MGYQFALMDYPGQNEPFYCLAEYLGSTAFLRKLVLELAVLFGQLRRNGVKASSYLDCGSRFGIFGHIGIVTIQNGLLYRTALKVTVGLNVFSYALRHTSNYKVSLIIIQSQMMN